MNLIPEENTFLRGNATKLFSIYVTYESAPFVSLNASVSHATQLSNLMMRARPWEINAQHSFCFLFLYETFLVFIFVITRSDNKHVFI
jgi:hypothetical protein